MRQLIFSRRAYWVLVATLIALKIGGVVVVLEAPQAYGIWRHIDTALVVVLALVVGGRFADIGWPRWLGITLVLVITLVVPLVIFFASPRVRGPNPLDAIPDLAWISTVLLFVLLIVAGVKRSASSLNAGTGGTDASHDGRKEPTFP
jgi:hypothetical protein